MKVLSGKFVLRIPKNLHLNLKKLALKKQMSLNNLILEKLNQSDMEVNAYIEPFNSLGIQIKGIILFGSSARGDATLKSDIDYLFVLDNKEIINRKLYTLWDQSLSKHFESHASPQFVHFPDDLEKIGGIWLEAAIEGKIIYDKNNEISLGLAKIRAQIVNGNYERKWSHGNPYWIRRIQNEK